MANANLTGAILRRAYLRKANVSGANLSKAILGEANLTGANLTKANLTEATLSRANLTDANLKAAILIRTNLERAILVRTLLSGATIDSCCVFGLSAWGVVLDANTIQRDLVITPRGESTVTVDNFIVAQFIYLLLSNPGLGEVIDTITSKVILILGKFSPDRKTILDAVRARLRENNLTPVMFDFTVPESRSIYETIGLLARMSRCVIADITEATEIRAELIEIVPKLPSVPVQPILCSGHQTYEAFEGVKVYPWVRPVYTYHDEADLLEYLPELLRSIDTTNRRD